MPLHIYLFLAASIKHMESLKQMPHKRLSLPYLQPGLLQRRFQSIKITAFFNRLSGLLLVFQNRQLTKVINGCIRCGASWIWRHRYTSKSLYTQAFHYSSLFVIFAIALMLMIIAILYDVIVRKTRLRAINILFGGGLMRF
jgi:ABC-type bacteriocin/lantibiotic exporter with double-glycine peptidase domain